MSQPHIYLVRPEVESAQALRLADAVRRRADESRVAFTTFRARNLRMIGEGPGRRVEFLEILDAHGMYRALHRSQVMAITLTQVYVRRDPSRDPPARRAALTLAEFVQHKGLFGLVRGDRDVEAQFNRLVAWCGEQPACHGIDDPRALPLHVFEAAGDWRSLGSADSDRMFRERFGPPGRRTDDEAKVWERASHYHGGEELTVSRHCLPRGAHWDVSTGRRKVALRTAHEVWQLTDRANDYLNVYPDAYVRKPHRSGGRRVWPRQR